MNRSGSISKLAVLAVAGAIFLVGCGSDTEEEQSANWLQNNGYELTVNDYLLAAEVGDLQAIELFREHGIAVDERDVDSGDTALIRAAGTGQMEAVRHFLSEGADVSAVNRNGRPALILAAQEGHTELVRLLLSHGADLEVKDRDGWNSLTAAAYQGRDGVVEVLAGKMSDQLDDALLVASLQGHAGVVDQLLNRGAYVNTRSSADQTPLMLAAKAGHLSLVEMLMRQGANPYALDRNEGTAANLAKRAGHAEVAEYLIQPLAFEPGHADEAEQELSEVADNDNGIAGAVLELPPLEGELPMDDQVVATGGEGSVIAETASEEVESTATATVTTTTTTTTTEPATTETSGEEAAPVAVAVAGSENASPAVTSASKATEAPAPAATVAAASPNSRKQQSKQEQEQVPAKSPLDAMKMESYREKPLPVMLTDVQGVEAEVRMLAKPMSGGSAAAVGEEPLRVKVREGEMIYGTAYRVSSVDTKYVSSKEGKGHMVDVSQMTVENTDTGEKHLLVKGVPGRSDNTYAVVVMQPGDQRYIVHERDRFTAVNSRARVEEFQVLEIRPTQVLIENLETRQVVTVEHDGVAMR